MIIGIISGVIPTASATEKRNDSSSGRWKMSVSSGCPYHHAPQHIKSTAEVYMNHIPESVRKALHRGAKRTMRAEKFYGTLYGTPQKCHPGKSLIGRAKLRTGAASSDYS
jgi:hypothetical protein